MSEPTHHAQAGKTARQFTVDKPSTLTRRDNGKDHTCWSAPR